MKLAVISDIHGNWRALDAVLADHQAQQVTTFVNLGDCVYGPFDPVPVMERLMSLRMQTVSGNEDRVLVEAARGAACSPTVRFTLDRLSPAHLEWLAALPVTLDLPQAFACHGAPNCDTTYLLTRVTENRIGLRSSDAVLRLLEGVAAQVVLCGHDHSARQLQLPGNRWVVNPGSVGCPAYTDETPFPHCIENESPHARYAVAEFSEPSPRIDLVSVPYNWKAAADEAAANGFHEWSNWIRSGRV